MKNTAKKPLVSVILPYFNHGKYIEDAVMSAIDQTWSNLEIILVDDCSTEKTSLEKLKILQKKYPKLSVLKTPKNSGPAKARNLGVDDSKGDFLLFLDSDDQIDPTFVEKALLLLNQKKDVSFVYSYIQHFGKNEDVHQTLDPYNFYELLLQNKLPYCAMIRRKAFEDVKGFDEKLNKNESEDWDFWLRMGKKGHYGYCLPEPLFWYRQAENIRLKNVQKQYASLVRKLKKRHRDLFRWWNVAKLRAQWSSVRPKQKDEKKIQTKVFHKLPQSLQKVGLKFYEAELLEKKHWKKSPQKCLQLMIPVKIRQKINSKFKRDLIAEHTKFSDFFPVKKVNAQNSFSFSEILKRVQDDKKQRTVLIFMPWIPVGGVETVMLHVLRKLSPEFHFILITTEQHKQTLHSKFAQYATVYHLSHLFEKKVDKIQFVYDKIQTLNIRNILIINSVFAFKLIPQLKTDFPHLSISTSLHGWDENFDFLKFAELFFPFLDHVICVSKSVKNRFEKNIEHMDQKIILIRNTLDSEFLKAQPISDLSLFHKNSSQQKNIVFLGRYNFDKRPHLVLDIANFLVTDLDMTHMRFFLFGEGFEENSLQKRAKEINRKAGEKMVFVEPPQNSIASIYKHADVCLNCSPREGFGLTTLEAIYFGVPVVAFNLDVFEEILPKKYFFPVKKDLKNPLPAFGKQIFAATQKSLTNEDKKSMQAWVEKEFDEKEFLQNYREVFQ